MASVYANACAVERTDRMNDIPICNAIKILPRGVWRGVWRAQMEREVLRAHVTMDRHACGRNEAGQGQQDTVECAVCLDPVDAARARTMTGGDDVEVVAGSDWREVCAHVSKVCAIDGPDTSMFMPCGHPIHAKCLLRTMLETEPALCPSCRRRISGGGASTPATQSESVQDTGTAARHGDGDGDTTVAQHGQSGQDEQNGDSDLCGRVSANRMEWGPACAAFGILTLIASVVTSCW